MGVPKFYRWLSERYPMINQMISGAVILPEIDNFYLDMNGIIHACTHPNNDHTANALSLREMMLSIFRYVDRIVTEIVKPQKLLFLAIDGVAPRAKLNQQRARRFRAAQDRLESIAKAKEQGDVIDEDNMFDSNCITPGTEFMDHVSKHLKYFIRKKIKEDPLWKNLNIIFSGHDVPGEGEHKIMTYIRDLRASPLYEPNIRHCMYGQDADLIMLGLACHEPHFCLLREVINFNTFKGRKAARETVMRQTEDAQFQLLHLSVLREYLALDFAYGIEHPVDQERIIDDFIFLTFLVGNDFLPHLPTLDISEHAFDVLINAYRQLYEENPGYIVANGEIADYDRLGKFFAIIGSQEYDILANREVEKKDYMARQRKNNAFAISEEDLAEEEEAMQAAFDAALREAMGLPAEEADDIVDKEQVDGEWLVVEESKEFQKLTSLDDVPKKDFRGRYYFEKFRIISSTPEGSAFLRTLMGHYLKGLGWCLAYYVKGCISWTWYYPYHYGPMLQDMTDLEELRANITYELGSPFTPYQQLLGCLPSPSSSLLPRCYQWLMTSADSPILDCYPLDFKIDQDGKKNPWEAVVLLDFIDEKKLLAAEAEYCPQNKLTRQEIARNRFGALTNYAFDINAVDTYLSCNPEIGLADIHNCNSVCTETDFSLSPGHSFKAELMDGTVYPIAGFPSLTVLQLDSINLEAIKLDVFGSFSRYKSLIINLASNNLGEIDQKKAELILGRSIYVNYPQMHEAKVIALSTPTGEFRLENPEATGENRKIVRVDYDAAATKKWEDTTAAETNFYLKGRGKPGSGGLNINETYTRLRVLPLQGMKRDPVSGARRKIFSKASEADIPLQLALWQPTAPDNRFVEMDELPIEKLLPLGTEVVAISGAYAGFKGVVLGPHGKNKAPTTPRKRVVDVEFKIPQCPEPPFGYNIARSMAEEFYSSRDVCTMLGITPSVLGKIVGSIRIEPGRIDLGLNLKRNGMHQLLGYIRKVDAGGDRGHQGSSGGLAKAQRKVWTGLDTVRVIGMVQEEDAQQQGEGVYWEYTAAAVQLMAEYKAKFPLVFSQLHTLKHEMVYNSTVFLGAQYEAAAAEIMTWMKAQRFFSLPRVPLNTVSLSKEAMAAIERAADVHATIHAKEGYKKWIVKSIPVEKVFSNLYHTSMEVALTYNALEPRMGDRIVNLCAPGVPFGLKGTVVTIHSASKYVEIIFDEEFIGGKGLGGNCSQFRGRLCRWSDLILVPGTNKDLRHGHVAPVAEVKETSATSDAVAGSVNQQSSAKLLSMLKKTVDVEVEPLSIDAKTASSKVERNTVVYADDDDEDDFLDSLTNAKQQEMIEKMIQQYGAQHRDLPDLAMALGLPAGPTTLGTQFQTTLTREGGATAPATGAVTAAMSLKKLIQKPKAAPTSFAAAAAAGTAPREDKPKTVLNIPATERLLKHELGISGTKKHVPPAATVAPTLSTPVTADVQQATSSLKKLLISKPPPTSATSGVAIAPVLTTPATSAPTAGEVLLKQKLGIAPTVSSTAGGSSGSGTKQIKVLSNPNRTTAKTSSVKADTVADLNVAASKLTAILKAPAASTTSAATASSIVALGADGLPLPLPVEIAPVLQTPPPAPVANAPATSGKNLNALLRNAKAAMQKKTSAEATGIAPALAVPLPPQPPAEEATAKDSKFKVAIAPALSVPAPAPLSTAKKVDTQNLFSKAGHSAKPPAATTSAATAKPIAGQKVEVSSLFAATAAKKAEPKVKKVEVSALFGAKSKGTAPSSSESEAAAVSASSVIEEANTTESVTGPAVPVVKKSVIQPSSAPTTSFLPSRIMMQKPSAAAAVTPVAATTVSAEDASENSATNDKESATEPK